MLTLARSSKGDRMARTKIAAIAFLLVALAAVPAEPVRGCRQTVTLAAVGDVLFARGVARETNQYGFDYPFEFTSDILSRYDLSFCNLECVLSTRGDPRLKRFLFRADPAAARALSAAGFDIVSLANNHSVDFGPEALIDTVAAIEDAGMIPIGTSLGGQHDSGVRFIEKNGLRIGFLALSDFESADEETPEGYPVVVQVDTDRLPGQVADARSDCDALVVSMHWGVDYIDFWTKRQQLIAEMCIESGADLVLGHHPHVLQDIKSFQGKLIVYSLGSFVWDSDLRGADQSAIYVFELGPGSAVLAETIPVRIVDCRPTP